LGHLAAQPARADVVVDHGTFDDAAIVRAPNGGDRDLVLTADVIAPNVDDAGAFGEIAATNAMSDVWAMGGEPRFALNLVFFPDDVLPLSVLDDILAGGARACAAAGVAVVGGHSVRDAEPKFGLSVTGDVAAGQAWSNDRGRPGQVLVLTKAIGTGVVGQAIKQGAASADTIAAAIASMSTSNAAAARIGRRHGVTAATDVTGFGLLGHLRNIARASKVTARIELARVPLLADALLHLRANLCPGGSKANRVQVAPDTRWTSGAALAAAMPADASAAELLASLACDAQTSGGLLLCLPAERADACVDELRAANLPAAAIGSLVEPAGHALELA
jgi:selenide,water dikinase